VGHDDLVPGWIDSGFFAAGAVSFDSPPGLHQHFRLTVADQMPRDRFDAFIAAWLEVVAAGRLN